MAKTSKSSGSNAKITFGRRKEGKARKRKSPMDKHEKKSRGQG